MYKSVKKCFNLSCVSILRDAGNQIMNSNMHLLTNMRKRISWIHLYKCCSLVDRINIKERKHIFIIVNAKLQVKCAFLQCCAHSFLVHMPVLISYVCEGDCGSVYFHITSRWDVSPPADSFGVVEQLLPAPPCPSHRAHVSSTQLSMKYQRKPNKCANTQNILYWSRGKCIIIIIIIYVCTHVLYLYQYVHTQIHIKYCLWDFSNSIIV